MEDEKVEVIREESDSYPCPGCGAEMHYNPADKNMKCEFCGTTDEINFEENPNIKEYSMDKAQEEADTDWGKKLRVLHCESCGAETNIEAEAKAVACPFCGSSHIIKENEKSTRIKPESLIPFTIDKKKAREGFKEWLKGKWLAPNSLKREAKSDKLQGVYIPYWTYDSNTSSNYVAKRGTYYYVTKTVTNDKGETSTERVRKTRWTTVTGNLSKYYDDIMVPGSKNHLGGLLDRADNYNLNSLVKYSPKFLSGFMAERYNMDLKEGWKEGKKIMDSMIKEDIRRKVGGDEFRLVNKDTIFGDVVYKHFLVPVWISNYSYKGKNYQYVVNGQNGRLEGHYPKSPVKIALLVLLGALIAGGIYYYSKYNS